MCVCVCMCIDITSQNRKGSLIIGSHHEPKNNGGSDDNLRKIYRQCSQNGRTDIVKVVTYAQTQEDAVRHMTIASSLNLPNNPPLINLAMGAQGQVSRVLNKVFTPVTHPLLPSSAAPGQMTVREIQSVRFSYFRSPNRLLIYNRIRKSVSIIIFIIILEITFYLIYMLG